MFLTQNLAYFTFMLNKYFKSSVIATFLLGLFSFGLFTKLQVRDKLVPIVCVGSPVLTFILETQSQSLFGGFGFAKLILNGSICFLLLWLIREKKMA